MPSQHQAHVVTDSALLQLNIRNKAPSQSPNCGTMPFLFPWLLWPEEDHRDDQRQKADGSQRGQLHGFRKAWQSTEHLGQASKRIKVWHHQGSLPKRRRAVTVKTTFIMAIASPLDGSKAPPFDNTFIIWSRTGDTNSFALKEIILLIVVII